MKPILTFFVFLYFIVACFSQSQKDSSLCKLKLTSCNWEVKNTAKLLAEKSVKEMEMVSLKFRVKDAEVYYDTVEVIKNSYNSLGKMLESKEKSLISLDSIKQDDNKYSRMEYKRTLNEYQADSILLGYKRYKGKEVKI